MSSQHAAAILSNLCRSSYHPLGIINSVKQSTWNYITKRYYSPEPIKRFYGEVTVHQSSSSNTADDTASYEIHLDKKKLKTPGGKHIFTVKNETLANVIATEWASQKRHVLQSQMHLTAFVNTAQDNPARKSKTDLIENVLENLSHDAITFRCPDNSKLYDLQEKEWNPVITWFNKKYNFDVLISEASILPSAIYTKDSLSTLRSELMKFNVEALHGIIFGISAVQSVILTFAVVNQVITSEEAVQLSRLESRFQIEHWGNVEWAHDLEMYDSMSRLSAGMIFFYTHNKIPFRS